MAAADILIWRHLAELQLSAQCLPDTTETTQVSRRNHSTLIVIAECQEEDILHLTSPAATIILEYLPHLITLPIMVIMLTRVYFPQHYQDHIRLTYTDKSLISSDQIQRKVRQGEVFKPMGCARN